MAVLAAVNTGAVIYFAILLRYLPAKKSSPENADSLAEDEEDDLEAAMASGILNTEREPLSDHLHTSDAS